VGECRELVDGGYVVEGGGAVWSSPPVCSAFRVEGGPGDGVPVIKSDGFDAGSEDPGPTESFGYTVEPDPGPSATAARGPGGGEWSVLGLEGVEDGSAWFVSIIIYVYAEDIWGHA
jgi:hypothetical protein